MQDRGGTVVILPVSDSMPHAYNHMPLGEIVGWSRPECGVDRQRLRFESHPKDSIITLDDW